MTDLVALLYTAAASPLGLELIVSDFGLVQQKLYAARRQAQDTSLNCLQFRRHPTGNTNMLWIVKGSVPSPSPEKDQP